MPPDATHAGLRTVFLDRDGVVNRRIPGDYVKRWEEFEFLPGAVESLAAITRAGLRTIVTTNQRGIAKGLYSEADLSAVHDRMRAELERSGARFDALYFCPDMEGPRRKPLPGMLLDAHRDFPGIDFSESVMIGDSASDLLAAAAVGCPGVLVGEGEHLRASLDTLRERGVPVELVASSLPDAVRRYPPLASAARYLRA